LDDTITALVNACPDLRLTPLQTVNTPLQAMTAWLVSNSPGDEWPDEFAIERACELRSGDEEKSVVKFNRHNLVTDQVREHIAQGKLPKWVAMSFAGRVSFVLTDTMQIKKIEFLDGVFEDPDVDGEDGFDTDVAIATGELGLLIPALIEALGGELTIEGGAA
jgi:recombination associated protein RdgC